MAYSSPRKLLALPAPPGHVSATVPRRPFFFAREPGPLKAGIRHIPSGTMTVTDTPLKQVLATLGERARYGMMRDVSMLEAVVVDWRHRVCAGFWL